MKIHGLNGLTLLDYPGRIACTLFTGHCNFRCPFCHNATLVFDPDTQPLISEEDFFSFLDKRKGQLEGVAITGGEPTLNADLADFCRKIREKGLLIKLDTNGTNPQLLRRLIDEKLVDCTAMDIKSAPSGYARAVGLPSLEMDKIFESTDMIMKAGEEGKIDYEFRTTVVGGIHTDNDFIQIGKWLRGAKAYYLQGFKNSGDLIAGEGLSTVKPGIMEHYRQLLLPSIPNTRLRGVT